MRGTHPYMYEGLMASDDIKVSLGSYTTLANIGFSPSPDILTTVIVLGHQQLN
jgi:hypothetical protein